MAITAAYNLEAYQFDAVNAFTNSHMDKIIHIEYPDRFKRGSSWFLLLWALYRLCWSPILWFKDFTKTLIKLELKLIIEEACLFISDELILFFYIDDIVILFLKKNEKVYQKFKKKLMDCYEMREIGKLSWFLGIRVIHNYTQRKIWLCQDSYIKKIAISFHLKDQRLVSISMTTNA